MRGNYWLVRLVVALAATMMILTAAPAAQASSKTLCTGFANCKAAGRTDGGYGAVSNTSYWNMTSGHNCTNYIAYRLSHGARLVARPPGTASAWTWADAARKVGVTVNDKPSVGAIAWWSKSAAPSLGHVAYVEQVKSDGSVLISEDNLNGNFKWRQLKRGSGWPSGFIHYPVSNGSPFGVFESVSANVAGQLNFRGISSDPDGGDVAPTYLATLGGPRGTAGVESFSFSTPYFTFQRIKTVSTRGPTTMYLYALNTASTKGSDVLLGKRAVTIRDASTVKALMVAPTITAATVPSIKVTLAPDSAQGTIDIMRGSTVLKTITLASGGQRTYTVLLPKQAKGTHTIDVRYRGSSLHLPSSTQVTLTVN